MTDQEVLPFSDAPSIVRAHQKDSYFEWLLETRLQDTVKLFKGQRFVNTHPEEITVGAKALYLIATTLLGSRTLGEEYVDLIYVSRNGKSLPKLIRKLGFILGYTIIPYLITRIVRRLKARETDETAPVGWRRFLSSYSNVLDTFTNLHVALFYFNGKYYQISKRLFGLRYAFGHNVESNEERTGNYSLLGGLILLQFFAKSITRLSRAIVGNKTEIAKIDQISDGKIYKASQLATFDHPKIDLSDPESLPYIPEASRKCMLCLEFMTDPAASPCGHVFCWTCIVDWCREHPECPLCRQGVLEQNLLPLR